MALLELRQLSALVGVVVALARLLVGLGFEPVDTAPAGLERDLAARAKALFLDQRHHFRPLVPRRGMENGEEPAGDEIKDSPLVGRETTDVVLNVGGDDRVVVADARIVDDAL